MKLIADKFEYNKITLALENGKWATRLSKVSEANSLVSFQKGLAIL